jgi:hypothetical protein
MLQAPLLAMLVAGGALRRRTTTPYAGARPPIALGPVVAATVLASILPMPALRQYLVPLAAPLIPWFVALLAEATLGIKSPCNGVNWPAGLRGNSQKRIDHGQ